MNLRNLLVLYRKELLDLLRDRRTLMSMVIIPMLMGPGFMSAMSWYMARSRQQARVERFRVGLQETVSLPGLAATLRQAGLVVQTTPDARASADGKQVDFGVLVAGSSAAPAVQIFSDQSEMKIDFGARRLREALDGLKDRSVESALARRRIPVEILRPFTLQSVNIAQPRKMTGAGIGTFIAFFVLLFLFNGALYAAVDMTAGEKERRTLEILLSSAASRSEIVVSKVLMAITSALITAAVSLGSYAISFLLLPGGSGTLFLFPADPLTLVLMIVAIAPVAVLAASFSIALATPAKSAREAMSYLSPVIFVVMFGGLATIAPEVQNNPMISLMPVTNFARLLKQLLAGDWTFADLALTTGSNILYAALAIAFAIRRFHDESVLMRG